MKSFRQYVTEEVKEAVFTFGRFNPPTTGHEKLLDAVTKVAGRNKYFVYASHSNDAKKNPLDYKSKIKFMRKMFPRHARSIILDTKAKSFSITSFRFFWSISSTFDMSLLSHQVLY